MTTLLKMHLNLRQGRAREKGREIRYALLGSEMDCVLLQRVGGVQFPAFTSLTTWHTFSSRHVVLTILCLSCNNRVMKARTDMPAIPGETAGMTRAKCMSYCFNKPNHKMKPFKFFGGSLEARATSRGVCPVHNNLVGRAPQWAFCPCVNLAAILYYHIVLGATMFASVCGEAKSRYFQMSASL